MKLVRLVENGHACRMVKRVVISITDDLDPALPASETVSFSYRGTSYEIDLSEANAAEFDEVMSKYLSSARKVSRDSRVSSRRGLGERGPTGTAEARVWAIKKGLDVPARGPLPPTVLDAYRREAGFRPAGAPSQPPAAEGVRLH